MKEKTSMFDEPKCPSILKHPIYSPGVVLLLIALEAFVLGLIIGPFFCKTI